MSKQDAYKQPVICIETGQTFDSLLEASRVLNVDPSSVRRAVYNGKLCAGYHWKKNGEPKIKGNRNPILCVETGEIFRTCQEAADAKFISKCSITGALMGRQKNRRRISLATGRTKYTQLNIKPRRQDMKQKLEGVVIRQATGTNKKTGENR